MSIDSQVRDAVKGSFCSGMDTYDKVAGGAARTLTDNSVAGKLANAARGMFCDEPPFQEPDSLLSGGQCAGVAYNISYVLGSYNSEGELTSTQLYTPSIILDGPLGRPNVVWGNPTGFSQPNREQYFSWVMKTGGSDYRLPMAGATSRPGSKSFPLPYIPQNVTASRVDGQPDNCGNPPYDADDYPPGGINSPIVILDNSGSLNIGEFIVDNSGQIIAPVTIDLPDFPLIGEINLLKGEINFGLGGGGVGDNGASPEKVLRPDADPVDNNNPPDEQTSPADVVGVIVVVSSVDDTNNATTINQDFSPDIYAPRLGNINFKYRAGTRINWSSDIPIKNNNNFIPNPSDYGAIDVVVNAGQGVTYQAFVVRGVPAITEVSV